MANSIEWVRQNKRAILNFSPNDIATDLRLIRSKHLRAVFHIYFLTLIASRTIVDIRNISQCNLIEYLSQNVVAVNKTVNKRKGKGFFFVSTTKIKL